MKKLTICLAFLASTALMAQHHISGTVTDASGNPLSGADLYSKALQKGTATNANGKFSIQIPDKGRFTFVVTMMGYRSKNVFFNEDQSNYSIHLKESSGELDEIIVTGVAHSIDQRRAPISSAVIQAKDMETEASSNIVNAITKIPGVDGLQTGPGISKPIIRGLGYNHVVTLYNGVRQEEQQWGAEHGVQLGELGIQRAEVIKGPSSLLYGSDALGGVINFITEEQLKDGEINGHLQSQYQSNNDMQEYGVSNSGRLDALFWHIDLDRKQAGNYKDDADGTVYNSGFKNLQFSGDLGWNYNWGNTQLFFNSFGQKLGIIEGERDETGAFTKPVKEDGKVVDKVVSQSELDSYAIGLPYQRLRHYRVQLEQNLFVGSDRLQIDLAYQRDKRQEFEAPEDEGEEQEAEAEESGPALDLLLRTYNYGARYYLSPIGGWNITWGANGMYQTNKTQGEENLIPNYDLFDFGGYGYASKTIADKWNLAGGLRFDLRHINSKALEVDEPAQGGMEPGFTAFKADFSDLSASLGLSYPIEDYLTVKFNAARGFRAPNSQELSANGKHEGTSRYERGNPNLDPETDTEFDLGLIYDNDALTLNLSGFYNAIADYIYIHKDAEGRMVDKAELFEYAQGDAQLWGAEAGLKVHPKEVPWLDWNNSFSLVNGQFQDYASKAGKYLPFIPAPDLRSEIKAVYKPKGVFQSVFLTLGLDYNFKQDHVYTLYDTETATPDYTLFHASVGCTLTNKSGNSLARIYVIADNLFDKAYQDHMSRLKYIGENPATGQTGMYQMGRNISFKLILPFHFNG